VRVGGVVRGTLNVCAQVRFHEREIALLTEAAADLSYALDNFARDDARREAEETLRREKLFSDTMIASMPGLLYFYDADGRFLRWNKNLADATGYTEEELAAMHPLDFIAETARQEVGRAVAEVFERGEAHVEAPLRARDGTTTPYVFTGRRVEYDGGPCLVGVGIDISERRDAEGRLAESERKYRELVELANSIIVRWDGEGRITLLNEFGQRFFGYTAEEIAGRHVVGTIVPERGTDGRDLRRLVEAICARPEDYARNVNENMRKGGERVWVEWTNRVVHDASGAVTGILSIGTDITDRRRAEAERERRHRAEAADRVKSAFLATMSHELRTPLNSIIGFTGIVLQGLPGPLNAEQQKQLEMVRGSARHLLALVNDVLDISKIEAGQLEVSRAEVDVHSSVVRVTGLVGPQAAAKSLTLTCELAADLGTIAADARRFEQILLNLLSNAIKFTEHGGVTVCATAIADLRTEEAATGSSPVPGVRITVTDTGIGIRAQDLPALFQPFRQIDAGLSRRHEGTGLGLAICRRLASLMGGDVRAESVWERGSTFTVLLPRGGRTGT
jgi:PAS domain S-box-containing protein